MFLEMQYNVLSKFIFITIRLRVFLYIKLFNSIFYRQPIVTGTSVLGIKFNGGVMMAADNLGNYIEES